MAMKTAAAACAAFLLVTSTYAQEVPVPKMLEGIQQQKGQWKMEILEGGSRSAKGSSISVCTDNLLDPPGVRSKLRELGCKHKLLKDAADEAVIESECKDRRSTITMKRDGASMLLNVETTGARGPRSMKMRYTRLGPCREGPG